MSPGSSSIARVAWSSGAKFRREANAGGRARAASIAALIGGDRPGPSTTRPPLMPPAAAASRACAARPPASSSVRASAAFMPAGYAAAAPALGAP
eukprot:6163019-Pleurochrysis_carterae.AAC.1